MNDHIHTKDLLEALKTAKEKNQPVYAAEGPCGGCDIIIGEPRKVDVDKLMEKLKKIHPHAPIYPGLTPCGGCDICLPVSK